MFTQHRHAGCRTESHVDGLGLPVHLELGLGGGMRHRLDEHVESEGEARADHCTEGKFTHQTQ
uniref:hypothetical protein n=1 Tax=Streptomyces anthocyanicus TaxID=68174 RepID=UPI002F91234D